jgi:hypothetical protein
MSKTKLALAFLATAALLVAVAVHAESGKKVRPAGTAPKVVSQTRAAPSGSQQTLPAELRGTKVKRQLFSSGTVMAGSSAKFYLNRAPGDWVHGTLGQMAVASGSSESFGVGSGFWQIAGEGFLRGDANGSGKVEFGDVIYLLNYLFRFDAPPDPYDAGDVTCDGQVKFGDVIYLLNYLFRFGPEPAC